MILIDMTATMPRGIDPKLTESYLLNLTEVHDASVWWSEGSLRACVAVLDTEDVNPVSLQQKCMEELGIHQTPRAITLMSVRPTSTHSSESSSISSISSRSASLRLAA